MLSNITAAVAVTALVAVLVGIGTLLARASRWPDFTEPPKHAPHPNAYHPRPYDRVILSESYIELPTPEPVQLDEPEPIDELDPRWDWRAYADALDRELIDA